MTVSTINFLPADSHKNQPTRILTMLLLLKALAIFLLFYYYYTFKYSLRRRFAILMSVYLYILF